VTIEKPKLTSAPSFAESVPAPEAPKRRLLHHSDDDDDDIIDQHAGKKARPDPVSSGKARPPCKYGGGCYRKNVEHKREFSHPGDKDWDQGSSHSQQPQQHRASPSPPPSPLSAPAAHAPAAKSQSTQFASTAKPQLPVRVIHDTPMSNVPSGSPATKIAAPRLLLVPDTDNAEDDPSLKKLKTLDEARKSTPIFLIF
jgi:hypothetical protein